METEIGRAIPAVIWLDARYHIQISCLTRRESLGRYMNSYQVPHAVALTLPAAVKADHNHGV